MTTMAGGPTGSGEPDTPEWPAAEGKHVMQKKPAPPDTGGADRVFASIADQFLIESFGPEFFLGATPKSLEPLHSATDQLVLW